MFVRRFAAAALLAAFAAGPILAQTAPAASPAPPAPPVKEKKICRTEEVLGSSIPQSTCHTQAEWAAIDSATAHNARDMMNHQPPR